MAHQVGGLKLPAIATDPPGAPFLGVLLDGFQSTLERYCGAAWEAIAPGEPIVRKTFAHNPEEGDFKSGDLPTLYLWVDSIPQHTRFADGIKLRTQLLHALWVMPPSNAQRKQERDAFWSAMDAALWTIIDSDGISPDTTTEQWGELLKDKAQLWDLTINSAQRTTVDVPVGGEVHRYAGYFWQLSATEALTIDLAQGPTAPIKTPGSLRIKYLGGSEVDLELYESQFALS